MAVKNWAAPQIVAKVRKGALRGVMVGIGIVERHAVHLITSPPKSGRVYRRRGVSHQASAPGEAPASDTSRLVNSRRVELMAAALRARLTFATKHARHLEHGTKRMAPRPFARRSLFEKRGEVTAAIMAEVRLELKT